MSAPTGDSDSLTRVVIDAIDVNALATNVISHLLRKDQRVSEDQLDKAGACRIHTLDDIRTDDKDVDETGEDHVDLPYEARVRPPWAQQLNKLDHLGGGSTVVGSKRAKVRRVTDTLLQIANELDQREDIWQLVSSLDLTRETAYETFADVAIGIFSDGFSWGKVAVLFVFAAQCVVRAILDEMPNILLMLSSFVARFIGQKLERWIEAAGGWQSLIDGSSQVWRIGGMMVGCIIAGVLLKSAWDNWL